MYPKSIKLLIESFKYFPGIGEKTAERLAFAVNILSKKSMPALASAEPLILHPDCSDRIIELDFFEEFGDANLLLKEYELFDVFNERLQIKKDMIERYGVSIDAVRQCAGKESEKMFTKINSKKLLNIIANDINYKKRKLSDKIKSQIDHLGYVNIIGDEYVGMAAVISVDTKYSPKLKMYSLKNGTLIDCKIDKKTFNRSKLSAGDVVKISGTKTKPKMKKIDDGSFVPIEGINELWITNYYKMDI